MEESVVNSVESLMPALTALFGKIREDSRDGEGVTRDAFGPRETEAAKTVEAFAKGEGLETAYDHGGNLHIAAPGRIREAPEIMIASHLDSVPVGGNYDGLAGVIAGLAVLSAVQRIGATKSRNLRVVGFRGEESPWFSQAYLGSKLLLGELTHDDLRALKRYDTGKTLAEHIAGLGIELPKGKLEPTIALASLKAYFELHIEQAPLLENLGRALGVATAIRGNIRHPFARCYGHYAHSGAVPRRFRRDALIASAKLIAFADERWQQLIDAGNDDLVFTCGIFQTDSAEHTMTKVPGQVTFTLNIGGTKNDVMEELQNSIARRAGELEREHNVKFDFGKRVGTPAVDLDPSLLAIVESAGKEVGITPYRMPTVGHDAAMFQRRGIPASVLLIRNTNGSHNPKEHMEMSDFAAGTKVLASVVYKMCQD
jgi:N-carbamoyl-L-amino-acid hydrolase